MIVYNGTIHSFQNDVISGSIAIRIDELFGKLGIRKEQKAEYRSWMNSLPRMANILSDRNIDENLKVAIEFQIPQTSLRVDFMIAGRNEECDNIIVIELKQWEKCIVSNKENVVTSFTGGANRDVNHPANQAYGYAKLIENFNEEIQQENVHMIPCAYLHNYDEAYRDQVMNVRYANIIKLSPVFLMRDGLLLQNFIKKYVVKPSNKDLFTMIDTGRLKPSKQLQEEAGKILNGNHEFELIDEQVVAYSTIMEYVKNSINSNQKTTIIVQGGPGTGKSVIAINLLAKVIESGFSCEYVTKNSAPRAVFSHSLIKGKYKLSYLKSLFVSSSSFVNCIANKYDCLLTDESHRLQAKSGLFSNKGENQIKEIINASKVSVFFIDEDQRVTTKDIGSVDEIARWAKLLNSTVISDDAFNLKTQFRCNGSDGYVAFLDDALGIKKSSFPYFELNYDIEIFDNPCKMRESLRLKNTNNKARMIAGYCYPWKSQKDKSLLDIYLENGFSAQWNFSTTDFAIDPSSFDQVGCIHSTQGLEFDYVGIIIGKDLRYVNGEVITDSTMRAKNDTSIRGAKGNFLLLDRIIRNTYKTLLSRGQKGCYVYCEDKPLGKFLQKKLNNIRSIEKEYEHERSFHSDQK